jgi:hypothetical protein
MDYNKMFQRMAVFLETGEHILRQTARKLEKEANPLIEAKIDGWKSDLLKYPDFYKLILGEDEYEKELNRHNDNPSMKDYVEAQMRDTFDDVTVDEGKIKMHTARRAGQVKAFRLTKDNIDAVYRWISSNPNVWTSMKLVDSIRYKTANTGGAERAFIGDWLIEQVEEEFDEVIYHLYVYNDEKFQREFVIVKE